MTERERKRTQLLRKNDTTRENAYASASDGFGFRLIIAVLLFLIFVAFDHSTVEYRGVNSETIIKDMERNIDITELHLI